MHTYMDVTTPITMYYVCLATTLFELYLSIFRAVVTIKLLVTLHLH